MGRLTSSSGRARPVFVRGGKESATMSWSREIPAREHTGRRQRQRKGGEDGSGSDKGYWQKYGKIRRPGPAWEPGSPTRPRWSEQERGDALRRFSSWSIGWGREVIGHRARIVPRSRGVRPCVQCARVQSACEGSAHLECKQASESKRVERVVGAGRREKRAAVRDLFGRVEQVSYSLSSPV
ncbi:hypothetical protein BJY59DRAFT_331469 [Rhodotorula toruloides]